MWEPAVSGMEKAHNCADLSYRRIRRYLVWRLKRPEARDFSHVRFTHVAGSLKLCENPRLRMHGYRRINFLNHRYFMMYRIVENIVFVDNIFHELQDYENKMC